MWSITEAKVLDVECIPVAAGTVEMFSSSSSSVLLSTRSLPNESLADADSFTALEVVLFFLVLEFDLLIMLLVKVVLQNSGERKKVIFGGAATPAIYKQIV